MASTFYNTNGERGRELIESKKRVRGQETDILAFFKRHPLSRYTRKEIELFFGLETPSATRALANLTRDEELEKSEDRIRCRVSGKMVHTWALAKREPPKQEGLF